MTGSPAQPCGAACHAAPALRHDRRRDRLGTGRHVPKHIYANANEIQCVVEGSGSFWLGDKEYQVHPGDLIIIPQETAHAGSHAISGRFKSIAIKTPPQSPGDSHSVP